MNSICDDKVLRLVGYELSRIGLFTAVSEIEQSAVLIYAKLRKAYVESNKQNFVLDSDIKDEKYYSFLSNAVIVDVFSRARLKRVRDSFELNSALNLLDKYLHQLSVIAGAIQFSARSIFNDMIIDLPIDMTGVQINGAPISNQLYGVAQGTPTVESTCPIGELHLCNNCVGDECYDTVNMTVEYGRTCFGFRVDPILLGLNQPLGSQDIKIFKRFFGKGCREFKANAVEIFRQLHEEYNNDK